jgi:hypothetical protein
MKPELYTDKNMGSWCIFQHPTQGIIYLVLGLEGTNKYICIFPYFCAFLERKSMGCCHEVTLVHMFTFVLQEGAVR